MNSGRFSLIKSAFLALLNITIATKSPKIVKNINFSKKIK